MTRSTIDRLTSLGEELLDKASQDPRASRVVKGAMQLKDRVDDLAKRVSGLEAMEKRLSTLESRLAKLERATRRPSSSAKRKTG